MEYEIENLHGDAQGELARSCVSGHLVSESNISNSNILFLLLTSVFGYREPY